MLQSHNSCKQDANSHRQVLLSTVFSLVVLEHAYAFQSYLFTYLSVYKVVQNTCTEATSHVK